MEQRIDDHDDVLADLMSSIEQVARGYQQLERLCARFVGPAIHDRLEAIERRLVKLEMLAAQAALRAGPIQEADEAPSP